MTVFSVFSSRLQSHATKSTASLLICCLLVAAPLAGVSIWAMQEIDREAVERERALLEQGVAESFDRISQEQNSITDWDDSIIHARDDDDAWMEENIAAWLHSFHGHDMVFVLNDDDQPIHAMKSGNTVPESTFGPLEQVLTPYVLRARAALAASDEATRREVVVKDLFRASGETSFVSVRPLVSHTNEVPNERGDEFLHITVRHLDERFVKDLADRYFLRNVHLDVTEEEPSESHGWWTEASLQLASSTGGDVGNIGWTPSRPGSALVLRLLPVLTVAAVAMLMIVSWLTMRMHRSAAALHTAQSEADHAAKHDSLTGLPNRALFNERLDQALELQKTGGQAFAVHFVDLDRFKFVNDTLGHPAGDELLRQVAGRLQALVRRGDTLARFGGDEFAVIQTQLVDREDALDFGGRLQLALRQPFQLSDGAAHIDSSIGTAIAPEAATDRGELMRKADIALYEAKGGGRARQCLFAEALDASVRRKRDIERDLLEALESGRGVDLAYQPLFAVDGVTLCGAEALLRWAHPVHGLIPPSVFVPVAEERGLMPRLGAWVLRQACQTAKDLRLPWIAVNVSAVQFRKPDFASMLLGLLAEIGLEPHRLQIEITEGVLLEPDPEVMNGLQLLRKRGVRIALDDFGTGYSSLSYLNRFRVDKIKIDKSFVQGIAAAAPGLDAAGDREQAHAVIRAIFDLARSLKLTVTAEGVETVEQWRAVADCGSPELQGFLFSKPLEREALEDIMTREAAA